MARARANPYGKPRGSYTLVRVGKEGEHTHILNEKTRVHLCRSGIKKGKVPPIFLSNARYVTCYRCSKLAEMNEGR